MTEKMNRSDIDEQWKNLGVDPDSIPEEIYNMTARLYDDQMADLKEKDQAAPEPQAKVEPVVRVSPAPEPAAYAKGFASGLGLGLLAGGAIVIMITRMKDGGNDD